MNQSFASAFYGNFLGNSPLWYKQAIIGFLVLNPILLFAFGPFVAGWALIAEFIFTLAMALKCYPLQPGGLLALEAIMIGMATPETVYMEAKNNFEVILLLVFTRDIDGYHVIAALMILLREIIVSGLREFLATLQVSMPVTQLAKWKTTFQLVAFGALILAGALPAMAWIKIVGLASLWGAAVLTLITGWDYLRVGISHMD